MALQDVFAGLLEKISLFWIVVCKEYFRVASLSGRVARLDILPDLVNQKHF